MREMILVKYGEIILKGLNRPIFEDMLIRNIKNSLFSLGGVSITKAQAAIYIDIKDQSMIDAAIKRIEKIFGVVSISRSCEAEKDLNAIKDAANQYCKDRLITAKTFKIEAKRADKRFPQKTPEICMEVGGYILENNPHLKVDVNNPEVLITVEIRDFFAYIHFEKIVGPGGMPIGSGGRATLLLSGGIDSPVAGYMIAKRGVEIDAVHFFSYPYTSERAKDKVIELARIVSEYTSKINVHIVPFTDIQLKIKEHCPEEHMTLGFSRIRK